MDAYILLFSSAAYVSLSAIILVEFLGLDRLSDSFGFLNMFRGIATFIGAPLAGKFTYYIRYTIICIRFKHFICNAVITTSGLEVFS